MSFGSGGFGSSGFGQNNTTQPSAFGGFGASTNTGTGFGAANNNTFGATNTTGGGLFGGGSSGGFGSNTGGFGQTNSAFGAKPTFGATTTTAGGSGLFGSSTTATAGSTGGFGGFGSTNTASTSTPFGGGSSLFGANKPATTFGSTTTPAAGSSLFGGSGSGFGSTGATAFGATNNPGLGAVGDPPGTAQVQFTPTVEKEPNNTSQSNSYQNILFQDPYKKWSAEELRLADYNQGRRHGNATGTGAFGVSSGFGSTGFGTNTASTGFGATNTGTGMFGSTQPASTGFGQTATNTTSGFGSSGNSLFGAAKPAGSGLFGSTTTTQPAQTGGLFGGSGSTGFGSTANTGTGFGSTANNTGGGLFGQNANQAKPSGFSFGNTGTTTGGFGSTATSGFGANTNTASTGTGLFGNTNNTSTPGTGLFGNTQQNTTTGFGTTGGFGQQTQNTGNSLFNQPKPAGTGLFGNTGTTTNTAGGLFGSSTTANPFGGATNNNQTQTGGLFGNKPAATGGLFGNTTQQSGNTGTGLFGSLGSNTQTQQPATGGLFGNLGQNNQQKPSPFGSTLTQNTGGLFGGQNNQTQGGGLFGNSNQQQQQGGLGNSLFGASQNSQAPQSLSTSINDISAFGSASLFNNLAGGEAQNPGPLATPLSGNKNKVKSRSILPMYKLSPANASRFVTPQKRGFGFSYSTYGTPSSVSSVASTPGGLGQSLLLGSSANRGLSKSISTSSLRRSFNVEDSILAPGSFSASSGPRFNGGHKKLVINKDMRSDLFSSPTKAADGPRKLTKRVSFDTSTNPAIENGSQGSGTNTPEEAADAQDLGYLRPKTNGTNGAGAAKPAPAAAPEMEQVKGKELAIVHEEEPAPPAVRVSQHAGDKEPGDYWMSPSKEEILAMNRVQRQKVERFTVGREHVGSVSFKVAVDLSNIDLDELYGNIVILEPRSATVYPIAAKKPPVGKGLNVPATISLEQSWPRARDKRTPIQDKTGSRIAKHVERLKRIENTTFVDYDGEHGIWTFSVEHFTTYGLDDDEEEDETEVEVAAAPAASHLAAAPSRDSPYADAASPDVDPDDTFEFKRSRRAVPGAFDDGTALSDDEEMGESDQLQRLPSPEPEMSETRDDEYVAPRDDESMADEHEQGRELVRAPSSAGGSVQEEGDDYRLARQSSVDSDRQVPAGIMRARMRAIKKSTAPTKIQVAGGDDWTQILQQSVRAPRRMDRATLRALNESGAAWEMEERGSPAPKQQQQQRVADAAGFATSIDLMKSLFEQSKGPGQSVQGVAGKGFVKWPYQRRDKVAYEEDEFELAFRSAPRVEWGPRGTAATTVNDRHTGQGRITIAPVEGTELAAVPNLQTQMDQTEIKAVHGVPTVVSKGPVTIKSLAAGGDGVWELASVLFDNDGADLSAFWQRLVDPSTDRSVAAAQTAEEKAVACLAGNRVADACQHLLAGKNFRLATLVAAVGANEQAKKDVREQLKNWHESNVLSEFSAPIRAVYEILAGNTCVCAGAKAVPIENRVEPFVVSERFGLDWTQAFGLRLWHGGHKTVAEAVRAFRADVDQDREPEPDSQLWGLLKLFADRRVDYADYTLGWQLGRALYANGNVSFGDRPEAKLDHMTASFAADLVAKGAWVAALFVLIHLSDPSARAAALRDQLGRHAHLVDDKDKDRVLSTLTQTLHIPAAWVWEAKALHARAVRRDPEAEFAYLLLAADWAEANRTFLRRVAPALVLARRYADLFAGAALLYRVRDRLPDWAAGGGAAVYLLFPATRAWADGDGPDARVLPSWTDALARGLVALRREAPDGALLEIAAIADMAEDLVRVGRRVWERGGDARLYKLAAGLPLTEDRRQKYLRDLVFEGMATVGGR